MIKLKKNHTRDSVIPKNKNDVFYTHIHCIYV